MLHAMVCVMEKEKGGGGNNTNTILILILMLIYLFNSVKLINIFWSIALYNHVFLEKTKILNTIKKLHSPKLKRSYKLKKKILLKKISFNSRFRTVKCMMILDVPAADNDLAPNVVSIFLLGWSQGKDDD